MAKTYERLASWPNSIEAIVIWGMTASTLFGIGITIVTVNIGRLALFFGDSINRDNATPHEKDAPAALK